MGASERVARLLKLAERVRQATQITRETVMAGGTKSFCGNGGSASDAQRMETEYGVRYQRTQRPLQAIGAAKALGMRTIALTAKDAGG